MYRSALIFGLYLSFAIAIGAACSAPAPLETRDDDDSSNGNTGNTARGGTGGTNVGQGGTMVGQGGTTVAQGGTTVGQGGSLPMGGTSPQAGRSAGGAATTGGASGAGRPAMGGTAGTAVAMGGTGNTAMGGTTAMGGSTSGSAGMTSSVSCDTTFAVSGTGLVRAPMKGGACWHGYASAGVDTLMPDAGTASKLTTATSFATCGDGCMLNMAGSLAASDSAYAYLGFNVNEGGGTKSTQKPTGTGLKVTFSKSGTFDVRVQISAGNAAASRWCAAAATSPASIPYATFNTQCWDDSGTAYTTASAIDQVQLSVPGKAASATTFDVTLVSVEEY